MPGLKGRLWVRCVEFGGLNGFFSGGGSDGIGIGWKKGFQVTQNEE